MSFVLFIRVHDFVSASELETPEDDSGEVDADMFWEKVHLCMIFRSLQHNGKSARLPSFTNVSQSSIKYISISLD